MVQWLSLGLSVIAVGLSWWWHHASAKAGVETRRIAASASDAQRRLANRAPWRVNQRWDDDSLALQFVNETGDVARDVTVQLDSPWYFAEDMDEDDGLTRNDERSCDGDIEPGSDFMHVVRPGGGPFFTTKLHVSWIGEDRERRRWSTALTWLVLDERRK